MSTTNVCLKLQLLLATVSVSCPVTLIATVRVMVRVSVKPFAIDTMDLEFVYCTIVNVAVIFIAVVDGQSQETATLGRGVTLPCHIDSRDVPGSPDDVTVVCQLL